jgi:chromosome segregation ATPase
MKSSIFESQEKEQLINEVAERVLSRISATVDAEEVFNKIDELQEKIKATQKTIGDLETKGKKGNADYRRAEDVLKTLQAELTLRKKNESVGKADYDKYAEDLSRYNDKIKIWDEKIAAAEGKVDTLKGEIANFNKELSKLDIKD